jgi:F1F0 ATPase subunit 2
MDNDILVFGVLWGMLLGLFYFGGLWLTVRRIPVVKSPKRVLLLSFVARITAAVFCFWLILRQDPATFGVTVLFFFLVRVVLTRMLGNRAGEDAHAN